jgi:hypothetical protein
MPKSFWFFITHWTMERPFSKLGVLLGFSSISLRHSLWAMVMGLDPVYLIFPLRVAHHCAFCTFRVLSFVWTLIISFFSFFVALPSGFPLFIYLFIN